MSASTVSFANNLGFTVTVYDSYSNQDKTNYFGTLTSLATVPANTTASVKLIHQTSVLIASNATTNSPLARFIYIPDFLTGPFSVGQGDVDAMAQTMDFITFITTNQNDPLTLAFQALWKDSSTPKVTPVNKFFTQHPAYASCTFATYMMGITYTAELPPAKAKPMDQAVYALSTLVNFLGGTWPPGFPDIVVTNFTCNTQNDVLAIQADIDLKKLPARSDEALQFFGSLFDVQLVQVSVSINYGVSVGVLGTRLSISLDAMHVPFANSTMTINKPTVTIDINPALMFVIFTVAGQIPFNIFGKAFEADVSMTIDNIEASFGVDIEGDNTSLPPPLGMQGVHFDKFGVGIGIIFEPPAAVIGLLGQLHIGDPDKGTQVALDDDTFAVVCQFVSEVPDPLYISFYVPQMHLTDVLTVFTNAQCSLDVPVSFTDLSFKWAQNPMEPVVLPDGSLTNMSYGFSAAANILAFSFYGDVEIDMTNGLTADIEMAPLALGSIFSLGGDGTGVSIKVDASGNPIKNNQLATTAAQQQALNGASMKQLVPPGGPVLKLQTFASPFLHLNGAVSLFELDNTSSSDLILHVGGSFGFGDSTCSFGDFTADVHIQRLSDLLSAIITNMEQNAEQVFTDMLGTGASWAFNVKQAVITGVDSVASVLHNVYNQDAAQVALTMEDVGYTAQDVASALQSFFGMSEKEVAQTMQQAAYTGEQVAGALRAVFGNDAEQITSALQSAYGWTASEIQSTLSQIGFTAEQIGDAFKSLGGDLANVGEKILHGLGL
ncbi:hypothetical protein F66182_807 [Fusarium sp. NRRL 66182]|nr:hypothetical protein F66182_807 [Fusarium sp. NRRL 66182]